jgi:hypothetical protein
MFARCVHQKPQKSAKFRASVDLDTPPFEPAAGAGVIGIPPMGDIVDFQRPEKKFDPITGICAECGNDTFETLFGPEDEHQARHLVALRCYECGEEVMSREQFLDS